LLGRGIQYREERRLGHGHSTLASCRPCQECPFHSRELFRIDLVAVVSKYIGETEKNLEQVFAAAVSGDAILFFDEANALFGKRSKARDAHDRYANIEISYLLQRMEVYPGLALLATNLQANLDPGFTRRLGVRRG